MGKGGGGSSAPALAPQQNVDPFAQASADIARQLFEETSPIRTIGLEQVQRQLSSIPVSEASNLQLALDQFIPQGTEFDIPKALQQADQLFIDPGFSQNFGALKAAQEDQFSQARRRVLESGGTGGALAGSLTQLEGQRALGLSQTLAELSNRQAAARDTALSRSLQIGAGDIATGLGLAGTQVDLNQRNIDRALNLGTGGTANALQGFNIAGNLTNAANATAAGLANAQADRDADAKGGKGSLVGTLGSAVIGRI